MRVFYLEPFAAMNFNGTYKNNNSSDKGDLTGNLIGAKIGFSQMGFSVGLDGRRFSYKLESESSSVDDLNYTGDVFGAFIGYDLPIMLRFWGSYFLGGELQDSDNSANSIGSPSGYAVGVGYKILPFYFS